MEVLWVQWGALKCYGGVMGVVAVVVLVWGVRGNCAGGVECGGGVMNVLWEGVMGVKVLWVCYWGGGGGGVLSGAGQSGWLP